MHPTDDDSLLDLITPGVVRLTITMLVELLRTLRRRRW
jgi:hypothetical protein